MADRYNYNRSRRTSNFRMERAERFVPDLIMPLLRNVSLGRFSGVGLRNLRPKLLRRQVSVIPISIVDPKTSEVYNISLYMRNDTAYGAGISAGGRGGIMELLDEFDDPTVLYGSTRLGRDFKSSYQCIKNKQMQKINHKKLVQAVLFIGKNLCLANTLGERDKTTLKKSIELIVIMVVESLRNKWVMCKFEEILNGPGAIQDMELDYGELIWNWRTPSEISRVSYMFQNLSLEAERLYRRKDLGLLFDHWEAPYACQRVVSLKCCNRRSDFKMREDRSIVEVFDYSPRFFTRNIYRYVPPCCSDHPIIPPRDAHYDPWDTVQIGPRRSARRHSSRDRSSGYQPY